MFTAILVEYALKCLKPDDYSKDKNIFYFWTENDDQVWIGYLLQILLFSLNGFYLAIIRLFEPFFLESLK